MVASSKLVLTPIFYGKRPWPGGPSIQQNWSLPNSMILYIAKNPSSSKVYQKHVQICKFFFEKNPIIIVATLATLKNSTKYLISQNEHGCRIKIKIDLNKFSSMLWITQDLSVDNRIENFAENILSKIIRCEVLTLTFNDNDIIFDDLKVLVSFAKIVYLFWNSIKYKNGTIVMVDKILECLPPNIELFSFFFRKDISMVNSSTMKNILQLRNLQNLKCFYFFLCPDTLSVEDLSAFMKKFEDTAINIHFASNISQEYKEQLDSLVDEIFEFFPNRLIPNRLIEYVGQDLEKREIMISRFNDNGVVPFADDDDALEDDDDEEYDEDEDLEDDDGFDVKNEPVVDDKLESDETESDAGSTSYIAFLFNKIKNFFKSK